ncbi:hypothetical protein BDR06DRAFT_972635 [Suillus hirtellus]|nr:hypothetical protein BDR06DRAFT_972635 [Suillus hirtellus]
MTNLWVYALVKVEKGHKFICNGSTVDSTKVEHSLGEGLWVPVVNQFVKKLRPLGLDAFGMLVVDFMHECSQLVVALDSRFQEILTFGNGVICKFSNNTSDMKRLAARDLEDILQCAIPAFEGLFPKHHDVIIQPLLYQFAQWHALAKLRLHTKSTITFLDETFKKLSGMLRKFQCYTCTAFNAVELPRERAAHQQKAAQHPEANTTSAESSGARLKKFNLGTYKFHAIEDYVRTIRFFGTTDSFTTQILAKHECRHWVLQWAAVGGTSSSGNQSGANTCCSMSPEKHHYIATNWNNAVQIIMFIQEHKGDPAVKEFIPKLKDHILYRLQKLDECNSVIIPNNVMYSVQTMQVYYTTYDLRWERNPRHPYWYAQVLHIYHMEVWIKDEHLPVKQHLDVLWVRWLAPLQTHKSGMNHAHLPKLVFVEESDPDAFGFLNPGQVTRGVHLILAFASGCGISLLHYGNSLACPWGELDEWEEHYVRMQYRSFSHNLENHTGCSWYGRFNYSEEDMDAGTDEQEDISDKDDEELEDDISEEGQ